MKISKLFVVIVLCLCSIALASISNNVVVPKPSMTNKAIAAQTVQTQTS